MVDRKFEVGDVVRVRDWEDMKEEFGLNYTGSIVCQFGFTDDMRYLCGTEFVITGFLGNSHQVLGLEEDADRYLISTDMLDKVVVVPFEESTEIEETEELNLFLDGVNIK